MRKLRIPGSSSMIRIEACANAPNSGLLPGPGLFAGSLRAGGLTAALVFDAFITGICGLDCRRPQSCIAMKASN
jgi:hypothetical protein